MTISGAVDQGTANDASVWRRSCSGLNVGTPAPAPIPVDPALAAWTDPPDGKVRIVVVEYAADPSGSAATKHIRFMTSASPALVVGDINVKGAAFGTASGQDAAMVELREGVSEFLADRPYLAPCIKEACEVARRYFGENTRFAAELFVDPETTTAKPVLFLLAQADLDPTAAVEALARYDREWWIPNRERTQGQFHLDVEFA